MIHDEYYRLFQDCWEEYLLVEEARKIITEHLDELDLEDGSC